MVTKLLNVVFDTYLSLGLVKILSEFKSQLKSFKLQFLDIAHLSCTLRMKTSCVTFSMLSHQQQQWQKQLKRRANCVIKRFWTQIFPELITWPTTIEDTTTIKLIHYPLYFQFFYQRFVFR